MNLTVLEIVRKYLEDSGYDGLYYGEDEDGCACLKEDLAPCGEMMEDCHAGYKVPCTCGEGHKFHIQEGKELSE